MAGTTIPPEKRRRIIEVFRRCQNKSETARIVGVNYATVSKVLFLEGVSLIGDAQVVEARAALSLGPRGLRIEPDEDAEPVDDEPEPEPEPIPEPTESVPDRVLGHIRAGTKRKHPPTVEEIALAVGVSARVVDAVLADAEDQGINLFRRLDGRIELSGAMPAGGGPTLEILSDENGIYRLGAMGDTHLGSKYERLDALNWLYDAYADEGVTQVLHAGNWIEGEAKFNKFDIAIYGLDSQLRYLARQYPQREGITTYAIAGDDHEGWYAQREGVNIGKMAANAFADAGRSDWHDLGYMEANVTLRHSVTGVTATLAVVHPGGGSAYATSYTVQKIVESYAGGEKPAVLFAGHYHKMEFINIRNVWTYQTGCTQDQTPFMRKKRLEAHVGGQLVTLRQDPETGAIVRAAGDILRYFPKGYYSNRWSHSGPVTRVPLGPNA
jgi:predicted phosphodiesterase